MHRGYCIYAYFRYVGMLCAVADDLFTPVFAPSLAESDGTADAALLAGATGPLLSLQPLVAHLSVLAETLRRSLQLINTTLRPKLTNLHELSVDEADEVRRH